MGLGENIHNSILLSSSCLLNCLYFSPYLYIGYIHVNHCSNLSLSPSLSLLGLHSAIQQYSPASRYSGSGILPRQGEGTPLFQRNQAAHCKSVHAAYVSSVCCCTCMHVCLTTAATHTNTHTCNIHHCMYILCTVYVHVHVHVLHMYRACHDVT